MGLISRLEKQIKIRQTVRKSMNKTIVFLLTLLLFGCATQPSHQGESNDIDMRSIMTQLMDGEPQAPDQLELEKYPLGSKENPIRVDGPAGEREYISRLICINGEPVSDSKRLGSAGVSPYGFTMDLYSIVCDSTDGAIDITIYMDMYHRDNEEKRAADGFSTIKPAMY